MNKKPLVIAVAMALSSTALSFALAAEEGVKPTAVQKSAEQGVVETEFDEVLVSATRLSEKVSETSRSVAVVAEEQLNVSQASSVAEVLKNEANINLTNGPRATSQGVEIRGLSGDRVLQTIDGARQNTSSGHRGSYFMDPELLKSIEVIRGPASSLWGSGALGGVVAQNTKSAQDFLAPNETFGGYLKQGYDTNGDRTKTSGAVYGQQATVDWLLNGSYFDSNNINTGNDETLVNSASSGSSGLAKFGWQADEASRLALSARVNKINELVPSNPSAAVSSSVPLVRRKTDDQNITLNYSLAPANNPYLDTHLQVYWNSTDYDEDRVTKGQLDSTEYRTVGINLNNSSQLGNTKLTYGVDGYRDTLKTVRDDKGQVGQRPEDIDGETTVWGAFTRADVQLTQTVNLDAALRYDSFKNQSHNLNASADDTELSPSLGLSWQTQPWLTLSARYDQAFRAPTVEEMFSSGTHYCIPPIPGFLPKGLCNTFATNPNLKSEVARNKELKADFRFNELAGDDELAITLNIFRNDVDDFIVQQVSNPYRGIPGLEQTTSWNNVEDAQLTGFELSGRYRIGQTRLAMNYGQTRGEDRNTGDYIEGMPANKFNVDLSQGIMEGDMKLGTRVTYVASQTNTPTGYSVAKYDEYTLWDVYLAWEPAMGVMSGLRVDFAIENIGDEKYQQAWQTLYQPGRNMKLSARYMF
ncbi:TonB-dependent hemoglobin/transferrin/lactoferrin family receptor [Shewanella oneidensis MR-1]|uniref:TonB-dependent heme/hemoglobin receptor HmuA n=1 Tax=Shewanella oneidensis (strain ATCC 700550 / JCM 31522 / CIP 106686 / LMG 19005 / NCIMB 14063 / MR-1) TaxID=211586 RepID=Q8EB65_SHEON|nr:TonB-dependent hemoglobin/transferrin/lactoferrin family receptor [Shewanella oneidensis]AAN56654.1 TonB-dependent heme/hemoglobin receptor HmuA [Shewanella oneidensis MR-1]MDX5998961.1 TonB-dependent hemoglobin/transferrin/lactoferrin family receptor [Shewanella oneidensis]MEE2027511.1 Heme/hemopexin utilization protein C [Shewanella oneidensis]QKG98008.1 TonB-dependent hemoglobin/transferrin/lactoferrin family receptor [Shewanella oneidensis MR-1]